MVVGVGVRTECQEADTDNAVNSAQTFFKLEQARYETGIDPYINVLTAQTTVLADQQTEQSSGATDDRRRGAGAGPSGGWDRSQLPSPHPVTQKPAKADTTIRQ